MGGQAYNAGEVNDLYNAGATQETLAQKITEAGLVGEEIPAQTLDIQSVKASTITILPSSDVDTATYKLALDYLDKEGNVIPAAQLPTDLTVSYVDNKDVFNTDGTIKNKDKIPASGSIKVVATVKSTAANINLTQEFEVTVVAANDWASVTDAKLVFNTDVTGTVAVVGDSIKLVPTVATKNDPFVLSSYAEYSKAFQDYSGGFRDQGIPLRCRKQRSKEDEAFHSEGDLR